MTKLRPVLLGLLLTTAVTSASAATTPIDPKIPGDYLALLGIQLPEAAAAIPADQQSRAINGAQAWLHRADAPLAVFPAIGSRFVDDPQVDVIVVVYSGGQFRGGPVGMDKSPAKNQAEFSGVLVVPSTGEVLRSFEIGPG
jgi:hypothetical protein